jgi:hypothetical protein
VNVVSVNVVGSWGNGVCTADIGRDIGQDGKTSGGSTTEPVGSERLVTEDRAETVRAQLGGCPISEELENESDFGEGGEDTSDMEFEILVFLLIFEEPVVLEFLEDLVIDDGVFAISTFITESANIVDEGVEEIVLEVDVVTDGDIPTSGRYVT